MRESTSGKIFSVFVHTVLIIIALTCILPFLHLIALSLSEGHAVDLGQVFFWPVGLDLTAYEYFFQNTPALRAFTNSVIITVGGTALSMLTTVLTAYPLSRRYLYARKPLTTAALFTMLFSGGMIPTYLVMNNLNLTNTYWSLWFVGLISTYNMLIMKSFFENIPGEVTEAAQIDGCGEMQLLLRVILPLSLPMLATLTLFYGVGYWNMFMNVILYINRTELQNLTVVVQSMLQIQSMDNMMAMDIMQQQELISEKLKAVGVMVMVVPMLVVYPFLQKYFVQGIMLGSIKG
ncbi:putative ABC transporter permease protein YtcP [Paenibacillus antibioticophila]|uniref:ABC transporter permease protein YtcP n=1 Tax=Paenibacillus antibioticophila TaxID=1274374 RepID=A0A919XPX9_9BACL|nr:carbohydrate ABC transporter permease [Paenibacillus antibioticophila]GIO35789.1 putative ABC transporter permease protein YtcP [Paenibacillus antibioticophila]